MCAFAGEDDGIDHAAADLVLDDVWIENFLHEGVAASGAHPQSEYFVRGNPARDRGESAGRAGGAPADEAQRRDWLPPGAFPRFLPGSAQVC